MGLCWLLTSLPTTKSRESHLGLFFMGKAMELKGIQAVKVFMTVDGRICIRQDSIEFGRPVSIFVNLDQFSKIEHWVFQNKDEIELTWNDGVEDE